MLFPQGLGQYPEILPLARTTGICDNRFTVLQITADVLPELLRLHMAHLTETPEEQPKLFHAGISSPQTPFYSLF